MVALLSRGIFVLRSTISFVTESTPGMISDGDARPIVKFTPVVGVVAFALLILTFSGSVSFKIESFGGVSGAPDVIPAALSFASTHSTTAFAYSGIAPPFPRTKSTVPARFMRGVPSAGHLPNRRDPTTSTLMFLFWYIIFAVAVTLTSVFACFFPGFAVRMSIFMSASNASGDSAGGAAAFAASISAASSSSSSSSPSSATSSTSSSLTASVCSSASASSSEMDDFGAAAIAACFSIFASFSASTLLRSTVIWSPVPVCK